EPCRVAELARFPARLPGAGGSCRAALMQGAVARAAMRTGSAPRTRCRARVAVACRWQSRRRSQATRSCRFRARLPARASRWRLSAPPPGLSRSVAAHAHDLAAWRDSKHLVPSGTDAVTTRWATGRETDQPEPTL